MSDAQDGGEPGGRGQARLVRLLGLLLGPALWALILFLPDMGGLEGTARGAAALTVWMAVWWITEAVPVEATALLPIAVYPLTGVVPAGQVTLNYANNVIFLFLAGFLLSAAIQKWGLHQRLALRIIMLVGFSPKRIVLGFMAATGFLSMWISNSAAAMMMIPIGLAVLRKLEDMLEEQDLAAGAPRHHLALGPALMLGIAYAASIGGVGTLIGSPPNAIFAGYVATAFGDTISFIDWMTYGLPLAVLGLLGAWAYLVLVAYRLPDLHIPGADEVVRRSYEQLGPMRPPEKRVAAVFVLVALAWVTRGFLEAPLAAVGITGLTDTTVGIIGALALFLVPAGTRTWEGRPTGQRLIDWSDTSEVPWGVLLLFGGGLALASGIEGSGLAQWAAEQLSGLQGTPPLLLVALVVTLVIFLTNVTSNTATATIFMPVMAGLGTGLGVHPYLLMIGAATAASFGFMLPVATPPNAIVFGTGYLHLKDMVRAGLWLTVAFIILITAVAYWWIPAAWGIGVRL